MRKEEFVEAVEKKKCIRKEERSKTKEEVGEDMREEKRERSEFQEDGIEKVDGHGLFQKNKRCCFSFISNASSRNL